MKNIQIKFTISEKAHAVLQRLMKTEMFGSNEEETAKALLMDKLNELLTSDQYVRLLGFTDHVLEDYVPH